MLYKIATTVPPRRRPGSEWILTHTSSYPITPPEAALFKGRLTFL